MAIVVNLARSQIVELKDMDVTGLPVGLTVTDTLTGLPYTLATSSATVDHDNVESVAGDTALRWQKGNYLQPGSLIITAGETVVAARAVTVLGVKANATNDTLPPIGVTIAGAVSAAPMQVVRSGPAPGVLTAATPGTKYWLSATAGVLTTTKPSTSGNALWLMGIARTATELLVDLQYLGTVA